MARYLRSYPNQPLFQYPPVTGGLIPAPGLEYVTPRFLIKDLAGQTTSPSVLTNVNAGGVSVSVGSLPTGLSIDADTGVISGTPTVVENQTFTVQAVGAGGTATFQMTISVVTNLSPALFTLVQGVLVDTGTLLSSTIRKGTIR